MKSAILTAMLTLTPLVLIGAGTWCIYRPAAPIVVGLLVWIDLNRRDQKDPRP